MDSPQQRLQFRPSVTEITELGVEHHGPCSKIISFGQGCEGEPSLNVRPGSGDSKQFASILTVPINHEYQCRDTEGIIQLCQAGLDSIRVTLFSARAENYGIYHRPHNYRLSDVAATIGYAHEAGTKVSINLLTMPGFTDREEEIESLLAFVRQYGVDMVQLRNLNIDADLLFANVSSGGETMGISGMVSILREELQRSRRILQPSY